MHVVAVDGEHPERRPVDPGADRAVVGVDHPDPDGDAGRGGHRHVAGAPGHGAPPGVDVGERDDVGGRVRGVPGRVDDQRPEQPALDLVVRELVGVVPERARALRPEPVDVAAAHGHRVLGHAGHAVVGVRHGDAVPVQGGAARDGLVDQPHLQQLPLRDVQGRPGRGAVEGVPVDVLAGGQAEALLPGDEGDGDVGRSVDVAGQRGDGHPACGVAVDVPTGQRRSPVVHVAHLGGRVGRRHEARRPHPAQRSDDDQRREHREEGPQPDGPRAAHRHRTRLCASEHCRGDDQTAVACRPDAAATPAGSAARDGPAGGDHGDGEQRQRVHDRAAGRAPGCRARTCRAAPAAPPGRRRRLPGRHRAAPSRRTRR